MLKKNIIIFFHFFCPISLNSKFFFYGNFYGKSFRSRYAFGLIIFFVGFTAVFISLFRLQDPNMEFNVFGWFTLRGGGSQRAWYITGLIGCTISIVLMGVAVQYRQLWLLFIGCAGFGIFIACMFKVLKFSAMLAYNAVGQKGIGSGLNNAIPGIWAASFSYWGVALTDHLSIQTTIYILAGISFAFCLVE